MAAWIAGLRTARRRVIHIVRLRMRPGAPTLRTATGVSPLESAIAPANRQRIRRFKRWDETGSRFNSGAAPATVSRNASVTAPLSSQLGKAIGAETYEPGDRPAGRNRRKAAALGILRESGARNPYVLGMYIPVPVLRVHATCHRSRRVATIPSAQGVAAGNGWLPRNISRRGALPLRRRPCHQPRVSVRRLSC